LKRFMICSGSHCCGGRELSEIALRTTRDSRRRANQRSPRESCLHAYACHTGSVSELNPTDDKGLFFRTTIFHEHRGARNGHHRRIAVWVRGHPDLGQALIESTFDSTVPSGRTCPYEKTDSVAKGIFAAIAFATKTPLATDLLTRLIVFAPIARPVSGPLPLTVRGESTSSTHRHGAAALLIGTRNFRPGADWPEP